ncbi:sigma-70 family RNA polymerase sigma factor [Mucilaginibacter aquaedulcis]|uniref:sigma-70 family RNA polymerase sigma factor n=1 Tax=Mucilaginibacter aquaedulcis TaxID=1187081 RepID=UPI0025B2AE03|nr:sigma-70 family RNA polymerase sigma factor [Mucilaginibacter aquaedulcis]MDN3548956.1 sigma-70 family RNA polymerase sigma factor [Mucilaginibacter aquaedulcis]
MREVNITPSITDRSSRVLEYYLQDIGKMNLLQADEEITIARQIKLGDKAALDRLVKTNLRFVVSVAKKYQHYGLPLTDLISEGNLGLITAAQKFDETKGFKFISYAVWWIRQSILAALTEHARMIRLPMNKIHEINRVGKAALVVEQQVEFRPSADQIAEYLGIPVARVTDVLATPTWTDSLDSTLGEDEFSAYDKLTDAEDRTDLQLMTEDATREVGLLLSCLDEKERVVIKMSFGIGGEAEIIPAEIARNMGLTKERIRQIRLSALSKLRNMKINDYDRQYS